MLQKLRNINFNKIAIALLTIKVMMTSQELVIFNPILEQICVIFAVCVFLKKLTKNDFSKKQFLLFGLSFFAVALTCFSVHQYDLLISFIAIYLMKDENLKEHIGLVLNIQTMMVVGFFCMSLILYFQGYEELLFMTTGDRLRFNAGFLHPNLFACHFLSCMLMYIWLNFDTMTKKRYVCLLGLSVFVYLCTKSRTAFVLNIFSILLHILLQKHFVRDYFRKYLKFVFPAIGGFVLFSFVFFLERYPFITFVDKLLTGRIEQAAYAFDRSGLTFFPRYLDYAESAVVALDDFWGLTTFAFDNVYSFCFIELGIVWFIVITMIIALLVKKTDYRTHFFVMVWILYGITEVQGFNGFKFFPILLLTLLFEHKEKHNDTANA